MWLRRRLLILVGVIFSLGMLPGSAIANTSPIRVLYINSYHPGYEWSDDIKAGVQEVLTNSGKEIELSIEHIDAVRFDYVRIQASLLRLISAKYRDYRPDIILTSDNYAFNFLKEYRAVLFPDIPVVFSGYNNFTPDVIEGMPNVTGVNEKIDYLAGIDMALSVHPKTEALAFVLSTGEASTRGIYQTAKPVIESLKRAYEVVELLNMSQAEVAERLARMPKKSLVFLTGDVTNSHSTGRKYSRIEYGKLVTDVSPFPVYTYWPFHLKAGATGGHVITGIEQGRMMAKMALRIINGETADDIPVMMSSPALNVFNYQQLKKFGVPLSRLPDWADVKGMPKTLWARYWVLIIGVLVFVVLQSVLIGLLYRNVRARKKAIVALFNEQELLETRVAARTDELQKANLRLKKISMEDGLTGLANRRYLDQALSKEVIRRDRHSAELSLMLIDIDYFKQFNDIYGHLEGDSCLQEVAIALQETCIRDSDIAARFGGEEFVIVLPNTNVGGSVKVAEKIMDRISSLNIPHVGSAVSDRVTVSVGLATVPKDISLTQNAIIELADEQLYLAKRIGRNRICACTAGNNQVTA